MAAAKTASSGLDRERHQNGLEEFRATLQDISGEFEGGDASLRAIRAAVAARQTIAEAQSPAPPEQQFRVAMGIDTGEILQVRADESLTYQAVGAMRMVAARLRDAAGARSRPG